MRFTNITDGPRGLNTTAGTVIIGPGQTSEPVELSKAELAIAKGSGWWRDGDRPAPERADGPLSGDEALDKAREEVRLDVQRHIADLTAQHTTALAGANKRADDAEGALATERAARQAAEAALEAANKAKPPASQAVHKGAGVYAVMSGDAEVKTGLTKDEAAAFNALPDDQKAAAVAEFAKPPAGQT